jgi:hypothetical protein
MGAVLAALPNNSDHAADGQQQSLGGVVVAFGVDRAVLNVAKHGA